MKLAHIADPHLGIRQYHRQTANGINQREADVAGAFRSAITDVIAAAPDAVLIAGDLFHSVRPTNSAIVFAFHQFQRLRDALPDAPVILIAGNHDTPRSSETGSILKLFGELGVSVAAEEARRFTYPALDLSVLAVPHCALVSGDRPSLRPEGGERNQVLMLHGEVEGVFPSDRSAVEYGGAAIAPEELVAGEWSYVALGHYHVQHRVAPRVWYAGALDYCSSNLWGERQDESQRGVRCKGWLLADLETGTVEPRGITGTRRVLDLDPIEGAGLDAPSLDAAIQQRIGAVDGGIGDALVRLVVRDVPRHVARALDHGAIRALKSAAVQFNLDVRRPETHRDVGVGAPGRRQTLPDVVRGFLTRRI
ncbi:MAG: DNA repair exonuclease, partial [Gemmatimonadales bacterium]|nr:DNA repair exonuclease [Gemmatimonadales bacterium]